MIIGKPGAVCQEIAVSEVYQALVAARRQDDVERMTKLFRAICELMQTALETKGMEFRWRHPGQPGAAILAGVSFSVFEEELRAAAEKYLPVWWEIKQFLDARLNRRQERQRLILD